MMKLTAGIGSIDALAAYAAHGADEVFFGYVPGEWYRRYSELASPDRREVHYANAQIGSESEMEILRDMIKHTGLSAAVTLNAPSYAPRQTEDVFRLMYTCMEYGFDRFIIADLGLLTELAERRRNDRVLNRARVILSGEMGEINSAVLEQARCLGAERVLFRRGVSTEDTALVIRRDREHHPYAAMEYEVFLMNENCRFTGAYCNSLHADLLPYTCRLACTLDGTELPERTEKDVPGATGCGLCALYRLREAGVTHLKLVGRGGFAHSMLRDISASKEALRLLEEAGSEEEYIRLMKEKVFPEGCGMNCYYPETENNRRY